MLGVNVISRGTFALPLTVWNPANQIAHVASVAMSVSGSVRVLLYNARLYGSIVTEMKLDVYPGRTAPVAPIVPAGPRNPRAG